MSAILFPSTMLIGKVVIKWSLADFSPIIPPQSRCLVNPFAIAILKKTSPQGKITKTLGIIQKSTMSLYLAALRNKEITICQQIICYRIIKSILDAKTVVIIIGSFWHIGIFFPFLVHLLRHRIYWNTAQPIANPIGNCLNTWIVFNFFSRHFVIRIFSGAFGGAGIKKHNLIWIHFNALGLHILMVNLALGIFHLALFLAPVILSLIAIHNNPGLSICQLQHISLVWHLYILFLQIAIGFLRNKTALIQGGHYHMTFDLKITGVFIVEQLITLYSHWYILGRIQWLPQVFLHFVGIHQKLFLILSKAIFPLGTAAILYIIQNICICITFTIVYSFCCRYRHGQITSSP